MVRDSRISVTRDREGVTLTVSSLGLSDGGKYVCALNLKHSVLTLVHQLNIEGKSTAQYDRCDVVRLLSVPPSIQHVSPGNGTITVRSGSRVRLQCRASGQPRPNIYWTRKHNQPFPWGLGTNKTVSGQTLSMTNLTRSYSGDYVCHADNGVGRWPVKQIITLDVLCKSDLSYI